VQNELGLRNVARWPVEERRGFAQLAPYAALLDVGAWPAAERRSLGQWLRAKGATTELEFAVQADRQSRFFAGLREAARQEQNHVDR
jgi:hypothetical protein